MAKLARISSGSNPACLNAKICPKGEPFWLAPLLPNGIPFKLLLTLFPTYSIVFVKY
jgi:hypothetical protein